MTPAETVEPPSRQRAAARAGEALEQGELRVVFVGQRTYFAQCSLEDPAAGIEPAFVDFRHGAPLEPVLGAVREHRADVVVVFRPELLPPGALSGLDALRLGFLTEPLPRKGVDEVHADLRRRRAELAPLDPANLDRLVTFDPLVADTVDELAPVWRSLPLPVSDRFFAPARPRAAAQPGAIFAGRSTEHRERFLGPVKHRYDVVHIAHGLEDDRLRELFAEVDLAINLHNEPYPSFENRVCTAMAAGLVVLTEPLSPTHGLEPGLDFLQFASPEELEQVIADAWLNPRAIERVRVRGRAKAERWRASRAWPDLLADLARDVAAFG